MDAHVSDAEAAVIILPRPPAPGIPDASPVDINPHALAALSACGPVVRCVNAPWASTPFGTATPVLVEFARADCARRAISMFAVAPSPFFSIHPLRDVGAVAASGPRQRAASSSADVCDLPLSFASPASVSVGSPVPPDRLWSLSHLHGGSAPFHSHSASAACATNSLGRRVPGPEGSTHGGGDIGSSPPRPLRAHHKFEFDRAEAMLAGAGARCTLMLRHVPCRWEIRELLAALEPHAGGNWDLVYLPSKSLQAVNAGYSFVNLATSHDALRVYDALHGRPWPHTRSAKLCDVRYARLQGPQLTQHLLAAERDQQRAARGYLAVRGPDGVVRIRSPAQDAGCLAQQAPPEQHFQRLYGPQPPVLHQGVGNMHAAASGGGHAPLDTLQLVLTRLAPGSAPLNSVSGATTAGRPFGVTSDSAPSTVALPHPLEHALQLLDLASHPAAGSNIEARACEIAGADLGGVRGAGSGRRGGGGIGGAGPMCAFRACAAAGHASGDSAVWLAEAHGRNTRTSDGSTLPGSGLEELSTHSAQTRSTGSQRAASFVSVGLTSGESAVAPSSARAAATLSLWEHQG